MQAVIFDIDGTLLDTREAFYWQYQELTRLLDGAPLSREMIKTAASHGTTGQLVRSLVRNDKVPFEDIMRQHAAIRDEAHERFLRLYEGVDQLLPLLRNMGFKVAAFTTDDQISAETLHKLGIAGHFDAIVMAEHVNYPKPHPEGVDLVLSKLGVAPSEAILVGDTVVDILVGRNAELKKTVGISHGFGNVNALHAAGADHVVHNIPSILDVLE